MRAPASAGSFWRWLKLGFWTVRERPWHSSCEPSHSDDVAASLDPEPASMVRASGEYLHHEDKATHANSCLSADPCPIFSVSPVKQMFQLYICKHSGSWAHSFFASICSTRSCLLQCFWGYPEEGALHGNKYWTGGTICVGRKPNPCIVGKERAWCLSPPRAAKDALKCSACGGFGSHWA